MAKPLLTGEHFEITLNRLASQLIENYNNFENTVLIGLQPRGIYLAINLHKRLEALLDKRITIGHLDTTFYRDDFRRHDGPIIPSALDIEFSLEEKNVILIDDVFFTGRSVRSGLEAMLAFGRPSKVELLVLVDRKYSRHLPIQADYVGIKVDTRTHEKVRVEWSELEGENKVWLLTADESKG